MSLALLPLALLLPTELLLALALSLAQELALQLALGLVQVLALARMQARTQLPSAQLARTMLATWLVAPA